MSFLNTRPLSTTSSGLLVAPLMTSFIVSSYFKKYWSSTRFTSPDEVILCVDNKQSMYCHLLCGLVRREEVVSLVATFASGVVQAITFLESNWKELCNNIRSGYISEWITDLGCKDSVSIILGGPNPHLADLIEQECSQKSWEGIITRLWPNIKFIQSTLTGQMSQYIPILEFYSNKLPLISPSYSSSETLFGVNVNPLCKPQDVSYTFMPNMSYFEFIPVDEGNNGEIIDLVNVKLGCFYETLVTNGFGHYVLYWELKAKHCNGIFKLDNEVMVECCCVMEESLNSLYREIRSKDGSIGPLEVRVVQQGTFDSLMEYFISKGASTTQYKTPLSVNSPQVLAILEDRVLARFFSDKSPPL